MNKIEFFTQTKIWLSLEDFTNAGLKQDDIIDIIGLKNFDPSINLKAIIHHSNGTTEEINLSHTYNLGQFEWFKAGSALNLIKKKSIE